uniref:7TM_GPCR_Srx domain-containing protein n=1 Tax=Mesocestoides corti TaxID=53468 RepID=A0A0R3UQX8_MESCO
LFPLLVCLIKLYMILDLCHAKSIAKSKKVAGFYGESRFITKLFLRPVDYQNEYFAHCLKADYAYSVYNMFCDAAEYKWAYFFFFGFSNFNWCYIIILYAADSGLSSYCFMDDTNDSFYQLMCSLLTYMGGYCVVCTSFYLYGSRFVLYQLKKYWCVKCLFNVLYCWWFFCHTVTLARVFQHTFGLICYTRFDDYSSSFIYIVEALKSLCVLVKDFMCLMFVCMSSVFRLFYFPEDVLGVERFLKAGYLKTPITIKSE